MLLVDGSSQSGVRLASSSRITMTPWPRVQPNAASKPSQPSTNAAHARERRAMTSPASTRIRAARSRPDRMPNTQVVAVAPS